MLFRSSKISVTLPELKNASLLGEENIINPVTEKIMKGCVEITYNGEKDKYTYAYVETCKSYATDPVFSNDMIPLYRNGTKWEVAGTRQWFNYEAGEWANAAIVKDPSLYTVQGTEINEEDIIAYMVWIPRFSYSIQTKNASGANTYGHNSTNINSPSSISIRFRKVDETDEGLAYYFGDTPANFKTHPAFMEGSSTSGNGTQYKGFWVSKFEMSGTTSELKSIPHVPSLRGISISTAYNSALNFGPQNNVEGESKLMRNTEWSAVAYLSQSLVGRCTSITACTKIINNNNNLYLSGGANYITNIGHSTTNNFSGVYDMSGLSDEYVMGMVNGSFGNSGFTANPLDRYTDFYDPNNGSLDICDFGKCFGHALGETSGWYGTSSSIIEGEFPFMIRGGNFTSGNIFYFKKSTGNEANASFRVTISN